jgi:hypothetical protein
MFIDSPTDNRPVCRHRKPPFYNGAITGSSELGGAIRKSDRTMLDVPKESLSLSKKARRELWH